MKTSTLASRSNPRRRPKGAPRLPKVRLLIGAAAGLLLADASVRALNGTWNVDADGTWSTPGNWFGSGVADGVDSSANFAADITATRTVTLDTDRTIGNLGFSDSGTATLSQWVLAGSRTLTLDRTSGTPTITVSTLNSRATIATVLAGSDGLSTSTNGLAELTAANTYSGPTTISGASNGGLHALDGVGLPANSNLTLNSGTLVSSGLFSRSLGTAAGQVQWTGTVTIAGFAGAGAPLVVRLGGNTNTVTWGSGNFAAGQLALGSFFADSLVDFQNSIDLAGATRTINVAGGLAQISGALSNGSITKFGGAGGTLILTGANSYGTTTVQAGTLQIGNGGTTGTLGTGAVSLFTTSAVLLFDRSDALAVANTMTTSASADYIGQNGSGTTTLSGDHTGYGGGVQVNRGTLVLDYTVNNTSKVGNSAVLTLGSGALQLAGGTHLEVVGSTTVNGAASLSRKPGDLGTATLRLNALTVAVGGSLNLATAGLADTDTLNTNGVLRGVFVGGNLAKNSTNAGDGAIVALVAADYTNVARVGGSIDDGPGTNVRIVNGGTSGSLTPSSTVTTINTLTQSATDGAAVVVLAGNKTLRLGAVGSIVTPAGGGALTFALGFLTAGGADNTAGELSFLQNSALAVTVNAGLIDNNAPVALSKAGTGTLILGVANTYTGQTTISGGVLAITDESNLGNNPATFNSGQLTLNGGTLRGAANLTINDSNRGVTLGAAGGTFSPDSGSTLTVASVIAGTTATGGLTKSGNGLAIVTAANTYTGPTTVDTGELRVSGSVSSTLVAVNTGATLSGAGTLSGSVAINDGGQLAPGAGLGTMTVGALSLSGTAAFRLELNTTTAQADLVNVLGALALDPLNTAQLSLTDLGANAQLPPGTVFTIFDYSSAWNGGTFAGLPDDSVFTFGGNQFRISYDGADNLGTAITLTVVPEPSPALLLGVAGGLACARRLRRAATNPAV
ncbi:MAG TPA: autotransporter-associated beta strand repeat-containing protein [Chthoniobacteraceae bacterium]|nr:autotransporter-associated beta strand repeat-containing protein [Chthoniobacteraceae bacterium]